LGLVRGTPGSWQERCYPRGFQVDMGIGPCSPYHPYSSHYRDDHLVDSSKHSIEKIRGSKERANPLDPHLNKLRSDRKATSIQQRVYRRTSNAIGCTFIYMR
jgi:hypothetical protein